MTLLHSASKGHLLSAFPYGQDLLPHIAIVFLFRLKADTGLAVQSLLVPILACVPLTYNAIRQSWYHLDPRWLQLITRVEQDTGFKPALTAWKAVVLVANTNPASRATSKTYCGRKLDC